MVRIGLTHHRIEDGKEDAGRAEVRGDFGEETTDDDDQENDGCAWDTREKAKGSCNAQG